VLRIWRIIVEQRMAKAEDLQLRTFHPVNWLFLYLIFKGNGRMVKRRS